MTSFSISLSFFLRPNNEVIVGELSRPSNMKVELPAVKTEVWAMWGTLIWILFEIHSAHPTGNPRHLNGPRQVIAWRGRQDERRPGAGWVPLTTTVCCSTPSHFRSMTTREMRCIDVLILRLAKARLPRWHCRCDLPTPTRPTRPPPPLSLSSSPPTSLDWLSPLILSLCVWPRNLGEKLTELFV